jgi:hypothetical protein
VEVQFRDEAHAHPVNAQAQFGAVVYNAPTADVSWSVTAGDGGPAAGSIDDHGVYTAPDKGALPSGRTEIVVAAAKDDLMRRACARVVLVGRGPEPPPPPLLRVYPRTAHLYYRSGHHNDHIDLSNKMQRFRAVVRDAGSEAVEWSLVGSGAIDAGSGLYTAPDSGTAPATATVRARLATDHAVTDEVKVVLLNYVWPGLIP